MSDDDDLDDLIAMCDSDSDGDSEPEIQHATNTNIVPESPSISIPQPPSSTTTATTTTTSTIPPPPTTTTSVFSDSDDDEAFLQIDIEAISQQAANRRPSPSPPAPPTSTTSTTRPRPPPSAASQLAAAAIAKQRRHKIPANHHQHQNKTFKPKPAAPVLHTSGTLEEFSGMRVKDRTIGFHDMRTHMKDRLMVKIKKIEKMNRNVLDDPSKDWVTIGGLYDKSMTKTSKNGKSYQIWTIGDLNGHSLSMFLFDQAFEEHKKIPRASLLIFLNPKILPSRGKNSIALSVTSGEQMIILGTCGNFGLCRSLKRDGRRCQCVINTCDSKYCDYHINAQYKKVCQGRMDVAGSKTGRGNTNNKGSNRNSTSKTNRTGFVGVPAHFSKGNYAIPGLGGQSIGIGHRGIVANKPPSDLNGSISGGSKLSRQQAMMRFRGGSDAMKRLRKGLEHQSTKTKHKGVRPGFKGMAEMLGVARVPRSRLPPSTTMTTIKDALKTPSTIGGKKKKKRKKDLLGLALNGSSSSKKKKINNGGNGSSGSVRNDGNGSGRSSSSSSSSSTTGIGAQKMSQKRKRQRAASSSSSSSSSSPSTSSMERVRERASHVQQQFVVYRETVLEANDRKRSELEARKRKNNELKKKHLAETLRKNNIILKAPNPKDHQGVLKASMSNVKSLKQAGIISSSSSSSNRNTFGLTNEKQKVALLKQKSINAKHGEKARDYDLDMKLKHLEEKDQMITKMSKITKMKITGYHCNECRRTFEYSPRGCAELGHTITRTEAIKRFWICSNCQRRESCLDKYMTTCCNNCGGSNWRPTGMKSQRLVKVNKMNVSKSGHGSGEFNFARGSSSRF
jgi:minichromosome maintenance protein 10